MILFCGLPVRISDAVYSDHLKVERDAIYCGLEAFHAFAAVIRNPKAIDRVSGPFDESVRTNRSVKVPDA